MGRHLFAVEDPSTVSLRKIASAAGYSPGTVYKYFRDQHELFIAIREQDMSHVVDHLERLAVRIEHPKERVRAVFLAAIRHWMRRPEEFRVLFSIRPEQAIKSGRLPFGRSPVVQRSYALYRHLVDQLFTHYDVRSCTPRAATDTLIAATHGIVAFTLHTKSLQWSNPTKMAEATLDALLDTWTQCER